MVNTRILFVVIFCALCWFAVRLYLWFGWKKRLYNVEKFRYLLPGKQTVKTNKQRVSILKKILQKVYEYTPHLDIFIVYGTLLGHVREKDIIPYDDDVDLAVVDKEWDELKKCLTKLEEENPDYMSMIIDFPFVRFAQVYHKDTNSHCDFSCFRKTDKKYKRVLPVNEGPKFSYDELFPIQKAVLCGIQVKVPNKPGSMLEKWYGKDYMTPDRKCDANGENCVKILSNSK